MDLIRTLLVCQTLIEYDRLVTSRLVSQTFQVNTIRHLSYDRIRVTERVISSLGLQLTSVILVVFLRM